MLHMEELSRVGLSKENAVFVLPQLEMEKAFIR